MTTRSDRRSGSSGKRPEPLFTPRVPAHAARLGFFLPTLRPTVRAGELESGPWGEVSVVGRLGQRHGVVLDSMVMTARDRHRRRDGRLELLVDPARIRRMLSDHQYCGGQLDLLVDELMQATVQWRANPEHFPGVCGAGHIIDACAWSTETAYDPQTKDKRRLWRVTLGASWVASARHDQPLAYPVAPTARLRYGVSQAVARLMLTHKPGYDIWLDTVLRQLRIADGPALRKARYRVRADAAALKGLGVVVDDGRVYLALGRQFVPSDSACVP